MKVRKDEIKSLTFHDQRVSEVGKGGEGAECKGPKDHNLKKSTRAMSLALVRISIQGTRTAGGKDRTYSGL